MSKAITGDEAASKSSTGDVWLKPKDLVSEYYVRKGLDHDRIRYFVDAYKSGEKVAPIDVLKGTTTIDDGRHRHAALIELGWGGRAILCREVPKKRNRAEQIVDAFKKNMGGPLPPTYDDVIAVMRQLLEGGEKPGAIRKLFEEQRVYKPSLVNKYLRDAQSAYTKARVQRARTAVANGNITVAEAAEKFGVDKKQLAGEVAGKKTADKPHGVADIKSKISNLYRGNTLKVASLLRTVDDRFDDGEMPAADVLRVLEHAKAVVLKGLRTIDDRIDRFRKKAGAAAKKGRAARSDKGKPRAKRTAAE